MWKLEDVVRWPNWNLKEPTTKHALPLFLTTPLTQMLSSLIWGATKGAFPQLPLSLRNPKELPSWRTAALLIQACKLTKLIRNDHYQSINLSSENQRIQWQSPGKLLLIGSLQFHALFHAQMGGSFQPSLTVLLHYQSAPQHLASKVALTDSYGIPHAPCYTRLQPFSFVISERKNHFSIKKISKKKNFPTNLMNNAPVIKTVRVQS